jgi:hypothetical protein
MAMVVVHSPAGVWKYYRDEMEALLDDGWRRVLAASRDGNGIPSI